MESQPSTVLNRQIPLLMRENDDLERLMLENSDGVHEQLEI